MKSASMTVALFIAALTSHAAVAQSTATIGKQAPDILVVRADKGSNEDKRHVIKENRGHLVVFYTWRASSRESVNGMKPTRKLVEKFKDQGARFIPVSVDSKERWEEYTKEHGEPQNTEIVFQARQMANQLGAMSEPYIVIVDGHSIVRWRGAPDGLLADRLKYLLERFPPPAGDEQWLSSRVRESERLLDRGEVGKAYSTIKEVFDFTDESSPKHAEAQGRMEKLESAAAKWLDEAIKAENAGDYDRAAYIVAQISVRLKDTDIAHNAEDEIGRMRGRRELKEKIRTALKNAEAEVKLEEADELADAGEYDAALRIYKQVRDDEDYEDTDAAKRAKRWIERLRKDDDLKTKVAAARAERRADRYLNIAEEYARVGMTDEARSYYQKLLDEYPNTAAATLADKLKKRLPS